jgi:hypothetical protein
MGSAEFCIAGEYKYQNVSLSNWRREMAAPACCLRTLDTSVAYDVAKRRFSDFDASLGFGVMMGAC